MIRDYNDVPGMIGSVQCEHIIELASKVPEGGRVIEIGCAWGRSTWAWMQGLPAGCTLTTIDLFMLDEFRGKHTKRQQRHNNPVLNKVMLQWKERTGKEFVEYIIGHHPRRHLIQHTVHHMRSDNFTVPEHIDLVYIDGNHEYEGCKSDLSMYGHADIVCGDDYKPLGQSGPWRPQLGVVQAVTEYVESSGRDFWLCPNNSFFWTAIPTSK